MFRNNIKIHTDVRNIIYIFTDDLRNIKGIYINFGLIDRIMYIKKDFDKIYDWYDDGKRYMRLEIGSGIYQLEPDEIKFVDIKSPESQIQEYVKSL